jgi:hypothetical protein
MALAARNGYCRPKTATMSSEVAIANEEEVRVTGIIRCTWRQADPGYTMTIRIRDIRMVIKVEVEVEAEAGVTMTDLLLATITDEEGMEGVGTGVDTVEEGMEEEGMAGVRTIRAEDILTTTTDEVEDMITIVLTDEVDVDID